MSQSLSISIHTAFLCSFILILWYKNWSPKHVFFVYVTQHRQGKGKGKEGEKERKNNI